MCTAASILHADTVVSVRPVWGQMGVCKAVTGVDEAQIRLWVIDAKVRMKKKDPNEPRSLALYRIDDILECVEELPDGRAYILAKSEKEKSEKAEVSK